MITLKIYDPAMCCSSGVCGPNVNDSLLQLSNFLKGLDSSTCTIERYNLSQQPEAYVTNPVVAEILKEKGTDALPLVFIDDKLICSGDYPPIEELAKLLNSASPNTGNNASGCCSGGCCS